MWWNRHERAAWKRARRLGGFLDEGSELEGKYTCAGTVVLEAKFCGEIKCKDTLIIGERGVVQGPVQATTLVVRGELAGDVQVSERVEIKAGARVIGDIEASVIVMEEGAMHDGRCRMSKAPAGEAPSAVLIPISTA